MTRLLLPLLVGFTTLFGANILSYNIYDRTDRVDVMLTFDTPYEGRIAKSRFNSKIVLKLYDAKIESTKIKHISSRFLKTLTISPMADYTQIVASIPTEDVILKASRTADAYGLRLRFVKKSALSTASKIKQQAAQSTQQTKAFPNLPTKQSNDISTSYYIVVTLLLIGVVVMLLLKRKITKNPTDKKAASSWLFKGGSPKAPPMNQPQQTNSSMEDVTIRFQKRIDEKNSVVMLDFMQQSYLLLIGENNNILLDRFVENAPASQSEFESILAQRSQKLEEFLKVGHEASGDDTTGSQERDTLRAFSNKASNIPYSDT